MMLNLDLIQSSMANLGLSQAGLAERCAVSREAVSNWLSGKSLPRPNKLKALSTTLELALDSLLIAAPALPPPLIAGRCNRALELAANLRELAPFVRAEALFAPPALAAPQTDDDYVRRVAARTRERAGAHARAPLQRAQLIQLHREAGTILVPTIWPRARSTREHALSVHLPDSGTSWVIFSLNTRNDEFNYLLAHQLGHCYAQHALAGDAASRFAHSFAQELLFPHDTAREALDLILASAAPAQQAEAIAAAYGISALSVIGQADRVAPACGRSETGLDTAQWRAQWDVSGAMVPDAALALFGSASLRLEACLDQAEQLFGTPVFQALATWQQREAGRAAGFIASILQIELESALALSHMLYGRRAGTRG